MPLTLPDMTLLQILLLAKTATCRIALEFLKLIMAACSRELLEVGRTTKPPVVCLELFSSQPQEAAWATCLGRASRRVCLHA